MKTINDGGPAFPNFKTNADTGCVEICPQGGMTLRDYFAGQALGSIPLRAWDHVSDSGKFDAWAKAAYATADAMLAAREAKL